ncbi:MULTISPECIES: hypothetical protein [unclassified Spirosoma]|uniref:hypothetical protein n=1 Tax=unclassified Spirosoma TaxID=2621999 RepID=UPI0009611902|nr:MULTISPECIES: hypothetical protein [unclassified Spirosoma]MBN8820771.1 hypothetical protein [Spirosoma sp.]OJW76363.1 MAG: hypothetical protein BGO59_22855 [Spirosoma sp. 48-14]
MEQIADNAFIIPSDKNGAVLQLVDGRDQVFGSGLLLSQQAGLDHIPWGAQDNQPNRMAKLLEQNNQVRPLLEATRDMIYGSGIGFFTKVIEGKTTHLEPYEDNKLTDWVYQTELARYAIAAINERVTNANHFTRFEFTPDGLPLLSISDGFTTRIGKPVSNKVPCYLQNPTFGESWGQRERSETIAAFDRVNPTKNVVSIYHSREHISGNPFYAFPSWWCSRDWIEVANLIPLFHKSGLQNGYNIKYVIKMPKDYFDKEGGKDLEPKAIQKKWAQFGENLKNWLSGVDNVNKSLLVRYLRGDDGKSMDSIDVVPLKNEMSDDAYNKVWEMANISITNAVGILPVLGGVTPGSKSGDSGSQVRTVADYQQHFRTPVQRQILLEPIQMALRIMGYKTIVPAFKEVQLTTLDTNPTGKQAVINHNQ